MNCRDCKYLNAHYKEKPCINCEDYSKWEESKKEEEENGIDE